MSDNYCMLCGRYENGHHVFSPRAPGCHCLTWDDADKYLPICDSFKQSKVHKDRCAKCEHDEACHSDEETP